MQKQGFRWIACRAVYALKKGMGIFRKKCPTLKPEDVSFSSLVSPGIPSAPEAYYDYKNLDDKGCFFFSKGAPPSSEILKRTISGNARDRIIAVANAYSKGEFLFYTNETHSLGIPLNWLFSPFTKSQHNAQVHWSDYPTFSETHGDIKDVWEPSRFACAFWLSRAYALTSEDKYAETFWNFFESWCKQNPPNSGPNWKCGQEIALRSLAWCFALFAFWKSPATSSQRVTDLVKLLAIQADRILANIDYAISQKNNHGISEATGLFTIGILFPELSNARKWLRTGKRILEKEIDRQVYEDGCYIQQSMNYHRVLLHDCIWAIRLAQLNKQPLAEKALAKISKAADFAFYMMEPETGRVPNYGANDGAIAVPLNSCDYNDFRPVVQTAKLLLDNKRALPDGDWNEDITWLLGSFKLPEKPLPSPRVSKEFPVGGYYTLAGKNSWAMIRCHSYIDRVAHVDPMHFDLWENGTNLTRDCGSYRYYCPAEPDSSAYFKSIWAHNTIIMDNKSPVQSVSQFTVLPWPKAKLNNYRITNRTLAWEGESTTYDHLIPGFVHNRHITCDRNRDNWKITDRINGNGVHDIELRWHLAPSARLISSEQNRVIVSIVPTWLIKVSSEKQVEAEIIISQNNGGVESTHYAEKTPIVTLSVRLRSELPVTIVSLIEKE